MGNLAGWVIGGLIGLGVVAVAGAAIYVVVNWDAIKKRFFQEPYSIIEKTMKLKVKSKSKKAVKIDELDKWDDKIGDFECPGDEVDSSLEVGDTITI